MSKADLMPPLTALRAFVAAGQHGSFQSAARELGVTPSAISHQVRALEEWLEAPLFTRSARQVTLTAKGRAVYEAVVPRALALEAELLRALSAAERRALTALLRKVEAGSVAELVSDDTF